VADMVGIDIGSTHVRAVRLRRRGGRFELRGHAEVARHDDNGVKQPLKMTLAALDAQIPLRGEVTVAASPMQILVKYLPTMPMPADRLERLLRLEMQQQVGDQELAADAVVLPVDGDEVIHCCVYAQADEVHALLEDLGAVGVRPDRVHVAPLALANALPQGRELPGDDWGLVVDIGAHRTDLVLQRGDTFQACRQLHFGGDRFTEALAKEWDVGFERAEAAKRAGNVCQPAVASGAVRGDTIEAKDDLRLDDDANADGADDERETAATAPTTAGPGEASPAPTQPSEALTRSFPEEAREDPPAPPPDPFADPLAVDPSASEVGPGPSGRDPEPAGRAPTTGATADHLGDEAPRWRRHDETLRVSGEALPAAGTGTLSHARTTLGPELQRSAEALAAQINSALAWFRAQLKQRDIAPKRIALCGAGAELTGLHTYLARRFQADCTVFDPSHGLDGSDLPGAHRYAAAIGCALAGAPDGFACDVRPESMLRRRLFWSRVVWPRVAAVLLLAAAGLFGWKLWERQDHAAAIVEDYRAQKADYDRLMNEKRRLQQRRKAYRKDYDAIVSRLFGGRDLLKTIRALKVSAPKELWITELRTTGLSREKRAEKAAIERAVENERGRGRGGRGEGDAAPAIAEVHDTLLDRGALFLKGFVKPDEQAVDYHYVFSRWADAVRDAVPPGDDLPLFYKKEEVKVNLDPGDEETDPVFHFELRLDYHPTRIATTTESIR